MTTVSSPCIKLCVIDAASGLCEGCGRTLDEIRLWRVMNEKERLVIMRKLPDRIKTRLSHKV